MRKMQKQQGFTIIELVVVILLLGILTATALPRFMDVTDEAHDAAVSGVVGGLSTGVGLFRAQWFGKGQPSAGTAVPGFGNGSLVANSAGYPIGTTALATAMSSSADCVNVFNNVLQGGAPLIAAVPSSGAAFDSTDLPAVITTDYVVNLDDSVNDVCEYVYVGQYQVAADGDIPVIRFDSATGNVTLAADIL